MILRRAVLHPPPPPEPRKGRLVGADDREDPDDGGGGARGGVLAFEESWSIALGRWDGGGRWGWSPRCHANQFLPPPRTGLTNTAVGELQNNTIIINNYIYGASEPKIHDDRWWMDDGWFTF